MQAEVLGPYRIEDALVAFAEHADRLSADDRREARLLLDEALAPVPAEYHESMCQNRRVNREILEAWAEPEPEPRA